MKKAEFKRQVAAQNLRCGHGHNWGLDATGQAIYDGKCLDYDTIVVRYNGELSRRK